MTDIKQIMFINDISRDDALRKAAEKKKMEEQSRIEKETKEKQQKEMRDRELEALKAKRLEKATSLVTNTFVNTRQDHDAEAHERHLRVKAIEAEKNTSTQRQDSPGRGREKTERG